jgi:hypothetical protein
MIFQRISFRDLPLKIQYTIGMLMGRALDLDSGVMPHRRMAQAAQNAKPGNALLTLLAPWSILSVQLEKIYPSACHRRIDLIGFRSLQPLFYSLRES